MSEIIPDADELVEENVDIAAEASDAGDDVGLTSDESANERKSLKSLLMEMTVFDSMLLLALLCATLATLLLFFELREFGKFPFSFPWRTSGF